MALSARDLYFAVRVEDRATRPLRRIAADMRALGRTGLASRQRDLSTAGLATKRAEAARRAAATQFLASRRQAAIDVEQSRITARRARESLVEAQNNLKSVQTGSQRIRQERSIASEKIRQVGFGAREYELSARMLRNRAELMRVSRVVEAGGTRRMPLAEAQTRLSGLRDEQAALGERARQLEMTGGLEEGEIRRLALLNQQETELAAKEVRLASAVETRGRAVTNANARVAESEIRSATATRAAADGLRNKSQAWRLAVQREKEAAAALERFPIQKIQTIGTAAGHAGRALAFLGAGATAALGFAGKAAADFSAQVTLAATQSTTPGRNSIAAVQKNANFIRQQIQNLLSSGRVIAGPADQTSAVYRIFSGLTLKGNQLSQLRQGIQLLREFNRVTTANVGLVTLEEATRAGIILINRFGVSAKNIRPALNTMQAAVRFGDMTMAEFIGTLNQMAPSSQAAGYSFTQMAGAAAFLSREFPSLRMGAAGYARLLEIFARKDVISGLAQHHVEITKTVNGVQKLIPLNEIAHRVIDRFGGSVKRGSVFLQNFFKEIGNVQGTIQARRALEAYLHHVGLADSILNRVTHDHRELQKSLAAAQADPGVRWKEFTIQLHALALEIGAGVIPAVAHLSGYVRGLASWFNQLSPHTKEMIGRFAIFTAVAVTLSGVLLTIVGGLLSLRIVATGVAQVFGLGLSSSAGSARVEIFLLMGGIIALSTALAHFHGFKSAFSNNLGTIVRVTGLLVTLRFGIIGVTTAINLSAAAMVRADIVAGLYLAELSAFVAPLAILTAALIGAQIGVAYLEDQMSKSVQYYVIVNGHVRRATKEHEKEARAVGEATANYNEYLRAIQQVGSVGPAGPIIPGGGIRLDPRPGSVTDRGDSPRFGFGKTIDEAKRTIRAARAAARDLGVAATPSFKKLFENLVAAKRHYNELKAAHADGYKLALAQIKVGDASAALTANATKQQVDAAKTASTAAARLATQHAKHSDAFVTNEARKVVALSKTARHEKTYAAWKAYYTALDKLQSDSTSGQMSALEKMFNLTDAATNKTTEKAKKHAKDIRDTYQQVLQNLQSQYQTFYSQNQNLFGQLFEGPYTQSARVQNRLQFGAGPIANLNKNDILKDLRSQVTRFSSIQRTIGRLRGRGIPNALLQQIESLGPEEAQKMLKLINQMTPQQIKEYSSLWRRGQKEVHDATMRDVKSQLKEWRRHGRRIGLAIAAGLRDENTILQSSLRSLITEMFPELAGKNTKTPPRNTPGPVRSTGTHPQPKHEHHTHYHITAPHSEHPSIKKQLDSANWHHRTRQP